MASSPESSLTTTSPSRRTRMKEKEELQFLNDRFISYIEQVRRVKEERLKLEIDLERIKEQKGQEVDSVKAIYETELADARNLIDETAKEKAQQQIMANKNSIRVDELEAEFKALKERFDKQQSLLAAAEHNVASLEAQRNTAVSDKNKMAKQVRDLEAEKTELQAMLDGLKKSLEAETLSRVDIQNHIQSLKEELAFRKKVHEEELAAMQEKLKSRDSEGISFQLDLKSQLEGHLEDAIEELREKSENEINHYKIDLESTYRDKINQLETQSSRDVESIARLNSEVRKLTKTVSDNSQQLSKLQKMIDDLEEQLRLKEDELNRLRQRHSDEVGRLNDELRALQQNYDEKISEYEQLMDVKVQLDQEIDTYRALLQEEENRLNITPTPREKRVRTRTFTQEREPKRPRMELESLPQDTNISSQATGFIQISDVDPSGKFVQLKNMSNQVEPLGGFRICHAVDDGEEEKEFRFHYRSRLQGQAAVTVWAAKVEGATHNPPTEIIWKSLDDWGSGAKTNTKLINNRGEVVATFTQRSEALETLPPSSDTSQVLESLHGGGGGEGEPSSSASSSSASFSATPLERQSLQQVGDEHMFHQKGDPTGRTATVDKCFIS